MTNHWTDIENADVILVMGSNAAENHPISFKWVTKAKEKGGTLISVDPRFTRTSSKADIYAPIRSGADIAFLGGMINYIIEKKLYFDKYVKLYTNASFILNPDFKLPGDNGGIFSGYDPNARKYDKSTWSFQKDENGIIKKDPTLEDPLCVFQQLKRHFSRYSVDIVSRITGTPKDLLVKVYKAYASTGKPGKAGTIMYAMGWTQHTVGTQNIRTMAIIQLLLGNMGVAGGGVNALRGESNVQGSTDHCLLFHILQGYLKTPKASEPTLKDYNDKYTPKTADPKSANWWGNYPKYSVSLLKAFFGGSATVANDFGYDWMPKLDDGANYSWLTLFDQMDKGAIKGFFAWGQNPACSGANAGKVRRAMGKLDWMVNVNLFENETGSFWKGPGMTPSQIKTEVFFLPCAGFFEKEGSITNSGRWMQWRYKAVDPVGDSRPDGEIISELVHRVKKLVKEKGSKFPDPILGMTWDYGPKRPDGSLLHLDTHAVAKEINGYFLEDTVIKGKTFKKGTLVPSFAFLQADGSTSSGNWLYCNSYTEKGNMAARRNNKDESGIGLYSEWSWCWPVNRRIIYNRASVDENGQPWDKEHPVIYWNGSKWIGDVPDGGWPPLVDDAKTRYAFIMKPEGHAHIFGPGLAEGPFPEHYEPLECPVEKNLIPGNDFRISPTVKMFSKVGEGEGQDVFKSCDPRYPLICSTYRVSEHWQTGLMTRWQPWLAELQPDMFVEMSKELANDRGIKNGDVCIVKSARGKVEAVAIVTDRLKPFIIAGQTVHQVGIPWHYGWVTTDYKNGPGLTFGDSANLLTPTIGDSNTMIPESKAFMVNVVRKGV
jgi:formate dehydrogenase major subunit